jgi:putative hydroxymethylpyrimidine transport system substrate-binding protein
MLWAALVGMTLALLVGCGESGDAETAEKPPGSDQKLRPLSLTLDGYAGPETMGIVMADRLGYFEEAGLDVAISKPLTVVRPLKYVANREVDVAVSHEPQVLLAQSEDAPVRAIGGLVSEPTAALIWLRRSKIERIADLKGKTIAIPGLLFQEDFLGSVLSQGGLTLGDVKIRRVGYELVPDLLQGRADAIFGGSWNVEGVELEARGLEPVITRIQDLGVPSYEELVLIVRPDWLSQDPQRARDFLSAVVRGTAAATEEDPAVTAEAILEMSERSNLEETEAAVEATLPLLSANGRMNQKQTSDLARWMREEGMIQR